MSRIVLLFSAGHSLASCLPVYFYWSHSSALAKPAASKEILILSQAASYSNTYLKRAYEAHGHAVTMVLLDASTQLDEKGGLLITNKN